MVDKYTKADLAAMLDDYEEDKFNSSRPWQPQAGENNVRLLPAHPNHPGRFLVRAGRHWGVAQYPVFCAVATKTATSCFACDKAAELQASSSKKDREEGKRMEVQPVRLANLVDLDHVNAGIQVAVFGAQISGDLMKLIGDDDYGDISDLDEGFNIVIEQEKQGQRTVYSTRAKRRPSPASDDVREMVEDGGLHDLVAASRPLDDDEMEEMYEGLKNPDDEDEEDLPVAKKKKPAAAKPARVSRRAAVEEEPEEEPEEDDLPFAVDGDEEEEEEELEEPEEEEEDEAPVQPVRRAPGRPIASGVQQSTRSRMDAALERRTRS